MIAPLLLASALSASPDFAFAFSNAKGTRLLALGDVPRPVQLTRATCDGKLLDVTLVAQQLASVNDIGRQTAANFEDSAGAVYEIAGATVPPDASCLLGSGEFFAAHPPTAVIPAQRPCSATDGATAARLGRRAVERCVEAGSFRGGRLDLVAFTPRGKELLVGLALFAGKVTAMLPLPAVREEGSPSCWRADDGCRFDLAAHPSALVLGGAGGPRVFATWPGAEGQVLQLLEPRGDVLVETASAYRYWAP
jgi:hypothetical protein